MNKLLQATSNLLMTFAPSGTFNDFGDALKDLMNRIWSPLIGVTIAAVALLGLWMGWTFWISAGDEQKRKKAKDNVKYFVIGIVVIFVVAALAPLAIAAFQTWLSDYQ